MIALLRTFAHGLLSSFRDRASLQLEIMALRHQLEALVIVQSDTVVRWHRDLSSYGLEVYDPASQATLSELANLPSEQRLLPGGRRLLRRLDPHLPTLIFRFLFVFIVLHHARRHIIGVNVTAHPTALWTAQQVREAFPWDTTPRYLIRDRDRTHGKVFRSCLQAMLIEEILIAPRSPWQNACAERVIGSIRRECLDNVIVLGEGHRRRILRSYLTYYHQSRTHLSLEKDCPEPRLVQPPSLGRVILLPQVGGFHHRYQRMAA